MIYLSGNYDYFSDREALRGVPVDSFVRSMVWDLLHLDSYGFSKLLQAHVVDGIDPTVTDLLACDLKHMQWNYERYSSVVFGTDPSTLVIPKRQVYTGPSRYQNVRKRISGFRCKYPRHHDNLMYRLCVYARTPMLIRLEYDRLGSPDLNSLNSNIISIIMRMAIFDGFYDTIDVLIELGIDPSFVGAWIAGHHLSLIDLAFEMGFANTVMSMIGKGAKSAVPRDLMARWLQEKDLTLMPNNVIRAYLSVSECDLCIDEINIIVGRDIRF